MAVPYVNELEGVEMGTFTKVIYPENRQIFSWRDRVNVSLIAVQESAWLLIEFEARHGIKWRVWEMEEKKTKRVENWLTMNNLRFMWALFSYEPKILHQ